jgi:phosphatidylserine decarboxylase
VNKLDAPLAGIAREGWPVVLFFALLLFLGLTLDWHLLTALSLLLLLLAIAFFREPERRLRAEPLDIHAPLSGTVMSVRHVEHSPIGQPGHRLRLRVNPFGGYALRAPIDGLVSEVPGQHGAGNVSWIRSSDGEDVVLQVPKGAMLGAQPLRVAYGQRVGHGRRVGPRRLALIIDMFVPENARITVSPGERVRAGESIVGKLRAHP